MNTAGRPRDVAHVRSSEFMQSLTGTQSRLYAYICSLMGGTGGARDVLQETNLALWDKADEYDSSRPFLPWAYRVAHFQVLAYRKRCARSRLVFDDKLVSKLAADFVARDEPDDGRLEALGDCMDRLPGPRRELIDRRYARGESVDQIAKGLRKPPNVVAASLYRIRKVLLECIESRLAAG